MRLTLVAKTEHEGVSSFSFLPPQGTEWIAGQSIRLEVPGFYGPEERRFTISSVPSEGVIAITTYISQSTYKQSLAALTPGTEVNAYDIRGDFIWGDNDVASRLFLAGGIGITPFRAILAERATRGQTSPVTLLHASKRPYFAADFTAWQRDLPGFAYMHISGRLDQIDFGSLSQLSRSTVYISGASRMVDAVAVALNQKFNLPSTQIKRDLFTGRLGLDD